MAESAVVETVWIDAEPEVVFPYFCDPERLCRWLGDSAQLDPSPGGRFAVDMGTTQVRGAYRELRAPHAVTFTWGVAGWRDLPPGSTTVAVTLVAERGGTTVRLEHRNLPESRAADHRAGWQRRLATLSTRIGDPR